VTLRESVTINHTNTFSFCNLNFAVINKNSGEIIMLKKVISSALLVVTLLGINFQTAFAKSKGDWSQVVSSANNEIAIKTVGGETVFGRLTSANETEIIVQIADKKELTNQTITFGKAEVKKVWRAELRLGGGMSRGKAAAIGLGAGAGVGAGIGVGILYGNGSNVNDEYAPAVILFTAVIGAGAGAVAGLLAGRSGHKKKDLIYEL
jgi:hypothetical protein